MSKAKKKILIVNNNLATGGVQRAFINLLQQIEKKYDITVFVFSKTGDYVNKIPPSVKVLEASSYLRVLGLSQRHTMKLGLKHYIIRYLCGVYTKIFSNHLPIAFLLTTEKRLSGFDAAISFCHSAEEKALYGGCNEFVLKRVDAKQKITFVHCDFLNYGGNTIKNREIYRQFDKIAAVSEGCKRSFMRAIPEVLGKVHCVYNCHNFSEYRKYARVNPKNYRKECMNIVTIARLSPEKDLLKGIRIVSQLIKDGYSIYWHIIGDGAQRNEITKEIIKYGLENYISLYGNQENPYKYLLNADLFLLISLHEAAPMVFMEAKSLHVPIITTNTISASEMVRDGFEGIVCENNETAIYQAIKGILKEPFLIEKYKQNLRSISFTNELAIKQFKQLMTNRSAEACIELSRAK